MAILGQTGRARASTGSARVIWIASATVTTLCGIWIAGVMAGELDNAILAVVSGVGGVAAAVGTRWVAGVADGASQENLRVQNALLDGALSYMSQGLCMFDAAGRLVFWNRRYAEIYGIQGKLRVGMTLREMLSERLKAGTLNEDPDEFVKRALGSVAAAKAFRHIFDLPDGRKIAVNNEPRPGGGWVSTHEDITERQMLEQERAAIRNQEQRRAAIEAAIAGFRGEVESLLASVSDRASALRATATSLFGTSQQTSQRAEGAAAAFNQASANVETAAAAASELSRSIAEIDRQLAHSNEIVQLATSEALATDREIALLDERAQKIGDVVKLIRKIAGQTNLLALNATIEAARAGESGRGFAVVASEVKTLAVQTAKATEEIASHISAVQNSTVGAVEAIRRIVNRMQEINQSTSAVAASVEQQNSATGEISQGVASAAKGTGVVMSVMNDVAGATSETRTSAQVVLDASETVEAAVSNLRSKVEGFLAKVAV
ncbi:MAG TPA: methyl-accepting chemotaxis protein [Xanthobacteraceae bacterium]|nr:methyl-accepting chemotaxis protein [Xanthobacteraceae bacterium]